MDIPARFERFDQSHAQAVETIRWHLTEAEPEVRMLVEWLMTTDANPYGFLPGGWAGALNSSVAFAALCGTINHALVDDGEINFVTVNGAPRITFAQRHSDAFEDAVLTDQEFDYKHRGIGGRTVKYEVALLDGVAAFIEAHARHEVEWLRKCFLGDARRQGIEDALEHYGANPLFREEWIDEARARAAQSDTGARPAAPLGETENAPGGPRPF